MQTSLVLLENLLQALAAGLLVGSVYGADVRRASGSSSASCA